MLDTERALIDAVEDFKNGTSAILTPEQIKLILRGTYLDVCGLEGVLIDLEDEGG